MKLLSFFTHANLKLILHNRNFLIFNIEIINIELYNTEFLILNIKH